MNCRALHICCFKRIIISALILLFTVFFSLHVNCEDIVPSETFDSGSGSESDPYIINTPGQLRLFEKEVNRGETYIDKYFALGSDIILNDVSDFEQWGTEADSGTIEPNYSWTAIGDSARTYFAGTFDGAYHSITGLYIDTEGDFCALFGCIDGGTVKNLSLKNAYIRGGYSVGAIVGELVSGRVENCLVDGIIAGTDSVGGIVGCNGFTGAVANCLSIASVNCMGDYSEARAGAVVGSGNAPFNSYYLAAENNANGSGTALTALELKSPDIAFLLNTDGIHTSAALYTNWSTDGDTPVLVSKTNPAVTEYSGEYSRRLPDVSWYDGVSATYYIKNAAQLLGLSRIVNSGTDDFSGKTVKLSHNIFYSNDGKEIWEPIGVFSTDDKRCFRGIFDGSGLTVYGLYTNTSCAYNGLFGFIENSNINNVTVMGSNINGAEYTGAIAGKAYNSNIRMCRNLSHMSGFTDIGGICGSLYGEDFSLVRCFNSGNVEGIASVGGICGSLYGAELSDSYNSGSVGGTYDYIGGITGESDGDNGIIDFCYNSGDITSDSENTGAIVGLINAGTVQNAYTLFDSAINSGSAHVLSADEMKLSASFDGFDFDVENGFWTMEGDRYYLYPELTGLRHMNDEIIILGDINRDGEVNLFDIVDLQIFINKALPYDIAADVNADGKLNDDDVILLLYYKLERPGYKIFPIH